MTQDDIEPDSDADADPEVRRKWHPRDNEALLSEDLESVLKKMESSSVTIGEIEKALKGRGFMLIIVILSAPFAILPFAPPGFTIPVGVGIALIGLRLSMGLKPWLPKRILDKNVAGGFIQKLLVRLVPIMRRLEKWLQERWTFLFWPGARNMIGLALAWSAVLLMLPPPMLNSPPAVAMILLAVGRMSRDGLMIILGYIVMIATTVYLFFIAGAIWVGVMWVYVEAHGWLKKMGWLV